MASGCMLYRVRVIDLLVALMLEMDMIDAYRLTVRS